MRPIDTIRGYLAVFGLPSSPITEGDGEPFIEVIEPGFSSWLRSCSANYDHARDTDFASIADGSLRLREDRTGIAFAADIPRTNAGLGVYQMMMGRPDWAVSGQFAFLRKEVSLTDGVRVERAKNFNVEHVAVTYRPAYRGTAAWLASQPLNSLNPHARALAHKWHLGALSPIELEVPNSAYRSDGSRKSASEREADYEYLNCNVQKCRAGIRA